MKLGFVGLGKMGQHMASRLLAAGYEVVASDIDQVAVDACVARGATQAASAALLADDVETVFVSLPTPAIVEAVTLGANGIGAGRVRTIVDLSTTGPAAARRIGAALKERGITLIDAPVSGGTIGAEAGTLAVMVSGDEAAYRLVEPALKEIGRNLFYLGTEPGQAQTMKTINNTLCAAATVSAFEGLVLGAKAGLDARTMLDVINVSSGQSFATSTKIPQCILTRQFPMRFTTALLEKDVRLCLDEGERLGVPMLVSQQVRQFLWLGVALGMGEQDYGNLIKIVEGWSNAQFGVEEEFT